MDSLTSFNHKKDYPSGLICSYEYDREEFLFSFINANLLEYFYLRKRTAAVQYQAVTKATQ